MLLLPQCQISTWSYAVGARLLLNTDCQDVDRTCHAECQCLQAMMNSQRQEEIERAQEAATSSLVAELELLRRQKAAADENARRMDMQVCKTALCVGSIPCNTFRQHAPLMYSQYDICAGPMSQ